MTPKERAAAIKLYTTWSSDGGQVRSWGDVRADIEKQISEAVAEEREACAQTALAIDSNRGNEKEIAAAIRARK